jgi:hypothetical protein
MILHGSNYKMWHVFVYVFLFHSFETISMSINSIPVISNVSLRVLDSSSTTMNGTCQTCLCAMILNTTQIFAFNCFHNNDTCQIFSKSFITNSFSLTNNSESSLYFLSLPINNGTSEITSTGYSTSWLMGKSLSLAIMQVNMIIHRLLSCVNDQARITAIFRSNLYTFSSYFPILKSSNVVLLSRKCSVDDSLLKASF